MRVVSSALVLLSFGCAGPQTPPSEAPTGTVPLYTTSGEATPAEGTHVMPDGTVMSGHSHAEHEATHVMPDGTVMSGHSHAEHEAQHADGGAPHSGATHVMPDGAVMPGSVHQGH